MNIKDAKQLTESIMDKIHSKSSKPDEFEVLLTFDRERLINVENGAISSTDQSSAFGIGIRAAFGKKVGMSFTTQIDDISINKTIDDVLKTAERSKPDEKWVGLPQKQGNKHSNSLYYSSLLDVEIDEIATIMNTMLANSKVPGVTDPIIPVYGGSILIDGGSVLMNSHGISAPDEYSFYVAYLGMIALVGGKPGPMDLDFFVSRNKLIPNPEELAQKIAKEAYRLSSAKKVELPDKLPVVFHPSALSSITSNIFLPSIRGDIKQQGNSILADRLGEELFPSEFNLFDDGTTSECTASGYFDAEGICTQKTPIFEKGVFKNFVYDHTTAVKDETNSTGNASRSDSTGVNPGAYANSPSVKLTNYVLSPGTADSLEALISDIDKGVYITSIQGAHQGTPETGEFTGVINPGYIIEKGELTQPIVGAGISGNFLDLFKWYEGATAERKALFSSLLPWTRFKEIRIIT